MVARVGFSPLHPTGQQGLQEPLSLSCFPIKVAHVGIYRRFHSCSPAGSSWLKEDVFGEKEQKELESKDFSAQSQFYSRIHILIFLFFFLKKGGNVFTSSSF